MLGLASAASAGEWTGTIKEIDEISRNIIVTNAEAPDREQVFAETTTAGATIDDLKEGDQVKIFSSDAETESGQPINAMQIDKIGE